jgi:hypothetical protein
MQRNARKLRCEELQLTKVILAAPFEETSKRRVRNEPFIYHGRSAGGLSFEKPLTLFGEYGFRPQIVQEASH